MSLNLEFSSQFYSDILIFNRAIKKNIDINKVDNFAKHILANETSRSPQARMFILSKIENYSVQETLRYLLGVSTIVPKLMSEELKLKYAFFDMFDSPDINNLQSLESAYHRIPQNIRLQIFEKLDKFLNGKKINQVEDFIKLLDHLGKRPFKESEKIFQDFHKLVQQKVIILDSGKEYGNSIIYFLKEIFRIGDTQWPLLMDCLRLMSEKVGGIDSTDLYWSGSFFIESSKEKEKLVKLVDPAFDLVKEMNEEVSLYSLTHAIGALEGVNECDRTKLVEVLQQLKKGMGEYVDMLISVFLKIPKEEWSEVIEPSLKLAGKHFCDNYLMVKAIASARKNERSNVAELVITFIENLHKEKMYGSEKAYIVEAAAVVHHDKRSLVMECTQKLYHELKSKGKELNGVELAGLIRAFGKAPLKEVSEVLHLVINQLKSDSYISEITQLVEVLSETSKTALDLPKLIQELEGKWAKIREDSEKIVLGAS